MTTPHQPRRIFFAEKQHVSIESFTLGATGPSQIRVKSVLSIMSTGTENIVFNREFEKNTIWDDWVKYPFHPGYAVIGRVEEVGSAITQVNAGDLVALRRNHASHHLVGEADCLPVPPGITPEQAVWFAFAHIAFMGAKAAHYSLGDSVLVIGAGPIGQMTLRWARALGAETITCLDLTPGRLALAAKGGADLLIEKPVEHAAALIAERCDRPPNLVFDATGNAMVFQKCLEIVAKFGRIVLIGDTGTPSRQTLSGKVMEKGITVVGAHDCHTTRDWTAERIAKMFFKFCATGRMNMEGMNTHSFLPEDCNAAYSLANTQRSQTMGILFDWDHAK